MVGQRRFGPLIACVLGALVLVLARMHEVQVTEHEVWAREAANLVRSSTVIPYRRGRILDREGRVLVRDEEAYEVEFVWREFRRGHPLGQIAQMRSLLLMRPIALSDGLQNMVSWADELVLLSPASIDDFGRGKAVRVGNLEVPATDDARSDRRWSRASDLHFYVKALLELDRRTARAIARKKDEPGWERPYLELAAEVRGVSPTRIREDLHQRLESSLAHLSSLARLIEVEVDEELVALSGRERLVALIERTRREVEDVVADDLFAKAAGFPAWRLDAHNLARLDLDWLRRCLYWDETRLADWMGNRGVLWSRAVEEYLAGYTLVSFKIGEGAPADRVVSALARVFQAEDEGEPVEASWRDFGDPLILSELGGCLAGADRLAEDLQRDVFPIQDPALAERSPGDESLVRAVLAPSEVALGGPEAADEAARDLLRLANARVPTWNEEDISWVAALLNDWHRRLQDRVAMVLEQLVPGAGGALQFEPSRIEAATEERDYVVRDRSARPRRLSGNPSYELVHLITRYPKRYAGFEVRTTMRRVPLASDGEPMPASLAEFLIGHVRTPYLADLLEQRPRENLLRELRLKLERTEEEEARIRNLATGLFRSDELRGGTGIEGTFDRELRGRNGYRETLGLQDREDGQKRQILEQPLDGKDLRLTIDLELQKAAQWVLEHPEPVPAGDPRPDLVWGRYPVGSICLITPEGAVLAAASVPLEPSDGHETQDGQRANAIDRSLRQPLFHPPGSVFKPFVAVWALEFLNLDPGERLVACAPIEGESPRYGAMRCWNTHGHSDELRGDVDLATAIQGSCNSYFAFVGERFFAPDDLREMAAAFGFGRLTGVIPDGEDRLGLVEQPWIPGAFAQAGRALPDVARQRIGNGLAHVTATPLQVARAYAGLATGSLPRLSLVAAIGGVEVPHSAQPLPFAPENLRIVHEGMDRVVNAPGGTAFGKGLDQGTLGFRLAAKTGSADLGQGRVPRSPRNPWTGGWKEGVRKHTWVAGWFPADEPQAILVVFMHDTSTTSSHGAVYLASQFLHQAAVRRYLAERGALAPTQEKKR